MALNPIKDLCTGIPPRDLQFAKNVSVATGSLSLCTFMKGNLPFQCLCIGTLIVHFTSCEVHSSVFLILSRGKKARQVCMLVGSMDCFLVIFGLTCFLDCIANLMYDATSYLSSPSGSVMSLTVSGRGLRILRLCYLV